MVPVGRSGDTLVPIGGSSAESSFERQRGVRGDKSVPAPSYRVIGQPEDLDGAKELANTDRYDFQWWILPLIGARSLGAAKGEKQGKKGADSGIDGLMVLRTIIQVKQKKL